MKTTQHEALLVTGHPQGQQVLGLQYVTSLIKGMGHSLLRRGQEHDLSDSLVNNGSC
jgi:hypothetical protein